MQRRDFIVGTATTVLSPWRSGDARSNASLRAIFGSNEWIRMPEDFIGLSYEMGQLYNPNFFSAENAPLVRAFRELNTNSVLRLGGHLSNITDWESVGREDTKQLRGVRHGIEDYWEWPLVDPIVQQNKHGVLTRKALENLRGFLDDVNWRLIYGLNFASGSAARAADEADAATRIIGDRLVAFVIGNEPDGFGADPFFRSKGYGFDQYIKEYENWVKTIRTTVPRAQFAGPDTDGKVDTWVLDFARRTKGAAMMLTSHYYGMGPASDPSMTAERLLRKVNPELDAQIAGVAAARTAAGGTPYRMDEGNSCFGGGRMDVSDAFASALWAADYILRVACAGFAGVNLHGGGVGVYTPIESSAEAAARPRPVYCGMQLAQMFAGQQIAQCRLETSANVTAYQGMTTGGQSRGKRLAFVNKSESAMMVALPEEFRNAGSVRRWELRGPSLTAKDGVQFGQVTPAIEAGAMKIAGYSATVLIAD